MKQFIVRIFYVAKCVVFRIFFSKQMEYDRAILLNTKRKCEVLLYGFSILLENIWTKKNNIGSHTHTHVN